MLDHKGIIVDSEPIFYEAESDIAQWHVHILFQWVHAEIGNSCLDLWLPCGIVVEQTRECLRQLGYTRD